MKKSFLILFGSIFVLTLSAGVFLLQKEKIAPQHQTQVVLPSYTIPEYGIAFSFPKKYFLAFEETNPNEGIEKVIVLAEDTPNVREIFSDIEKGTEGPISFTIQIFSSDEKNKSAQSFFENNPHSNRALTDGTTEEIPVASTTGIRYHATGLYENENVLVATSDFVYLFTAFYNTPTDSVLQDFETILSSVAFLDPEMTFDMPPEPGEMVPQI